MLRNYLKIGFVFLVLFGLATGCATTKMTSTWSDPAYNSGSIKKAVVIGVAKSDGIRRVFEEGFVNQLKINGTDAMESYTMFSLKEADERPDAIKSQLIGKGFDTVIVTRMIDKSTELKYYPPTPTYMGPPRAYYGGWHGYYHMGYDYYYSSPGGVQTYDKVKLECNVYSLKDGKLLFSGLSDTTTSSGIETKGEEIISVLVKNILGK